MNRKCLNYCSNNLSGKQEKFCSPECSKKWHKRDWARRNRDKINNNKRLWRRKTGRLSDKTWQLKNAIKYKVQNEFRNAVSQGKIIRQPCFVCSKPEAQGHHPDYSKPFDVIWLCPLHHNQIHMKK